MSSPEINPAHISFVSAADVLGPFVSSLKRVKSAKTLALHQKRLQFLAQNFDPFASTMSNECQQVVTFYGLDGAIQDPFLFTNVILRMLDVLEEKQRALTA